MKSLSQSLSKWYLENRRELPWRTSKDAYRIWISEVMLQQTTVQAVIPFYERFLNKFPRVQDLAQAPLPEVLEAWAGLGYYSRARNLHQAAQEFAKRGFPQSAEELLELPGFGPYTSRAVAALAFGEKVGVLDGNVIRVLSRVFGLKVNWWATEARRDLQKRSDALAQFGDPSVINQGLMELGATLCTPQKPLCLMCPWRKDCVALKQDLVEELPLKKARRLSEVWVWSPVILKKKDKFAVIPNDYAPFLKGQLIFPGKIEKQAKKPKSFALQHGITHHSIYILLDSPTSAELKKMSTMIAKTRGVQWVSANELKKINPSSMLQKIIEVS